MTKTILKTLLTASLLLLVGTVGANAQTIVDSPHDLSTNNVNGTPSNSGTDELCVFCHTPHFTADPATSPVALWNRTDPVSTTFAMYDSPTIDMTIASNPQGVSLACLSCHDGATAFDSLLNPPQVFTPGPEIMTNPLTRIGFDGMANDHPISVTYDPSQDVGNFNAAIAGKIGGALPLFRAPGAPAGSDGDQIECASCHNPHDWTTNGKFLRVTNAASNLCTLCHIK